MEGRSTPFRCCNHFKLSTGEDQTLLVGRDAFLPSFLILNFGFNIVDGILNFQSDGLAGQSLHKN